MTKLLQKAFERAQRLPDDEQDAAGAALLDYLDHMHAIQLSDEQVAEVRRRLAHAERTTLSVAEVRSRLQDRSA
jgi:hypothetical protein